MVLEFQQQTHQANIFGQFSININFIGYALFLKIGATTTDLPPGTLYRVKATYKYVKEDVDELSFEVGDTIRVIEYDDPEDQVNMFNCYMTDPDRWRKSAIY